MSDNGRTAARSGLGAVMGSKKLKAVVVKGDGDIPVYDSSNLQELVQNWYDERKKDET